MRQAQNCQKAEFHLGIAEELQFRTHKLQQAADESVEDLGCAVFMDREHKEVRVQLESAKIKNKWRPFLKISEETKTRPVPQTKLSSA